MAYATAADVQSRMTRTMSGEELSVCEVLLDDAAVLIDAYGTTAAEDIKKVVSCRMVVRAIGAGGDSADIPVGASQGSMSALGYTQSWTMGSGSTGELFLSKTEKLMLEEGNQIGSYSPVQELVPKGEES